MSAFRFQSTVHRMAAALSRDFCPSANRWVYWLKNPFWILVLATGGSALCGALLNPMIFALTAMLVAVTLVGVGLPWLAIRGISCDVMFDVKRVRFGEPALVRLRIRNRSWLPVLGLSCIDGFTRVSKATAATDSDDGLAFGRIRGRATVEYTWPFVATVRGQYPVNDSVMVETSFPFGLYRAQKSAAVVGRLIVWPETVQLDGLPDSVECESVDDHFSDRRAGEFGDMLGTRLFRQGDSLRRVHWAQTARQQSLIVTERQAPVTTVARVVLDLSSASHPLDRRYQSLEQCVRVAASVCYSLHQQHCRVELKIGDQLIVGGQQSGALDRIMDALATANIPEASSATGTPDGPDGLSASVREAGGFCVTITTPPGIHAMKGPHIVITSDDGAEPAVPTAWLTLSTAAELSELKRLWKERV